MPAPVRPSQFTALVPSANDRLWTVIIKFFRAQFLYWRWHKYAFKTAGQISNAWASDICQATVVNASTLANSNLTATVQGALPTNPKTPCAKIGGVIPHINFVTGEVEWQFKDNGDFSDNMKALFCGLPCFKPPTLGGNCADLTLYTWVTSAQDTAIGMTFNSHNMLNGFAYTIYKSEDAVNWSEITSGTTQGSSISYLATGLTNGQEYFFKCSVTQTINGTPCQTYDMITEHPTTPTAVVTCTYEGISLTASSTEVGKVSLKINGVPFVGYAVTILRSTAQNDPGSFILPDAGPSDYSWIDTGLNPGDTYYYNIKIVKPGCDAEVAPWLRSGAVRVMTPPIVAPSISITGRTLRITYVANAVFYRVYNRAYAHAQALQAAVNNAGPSGTDYAIPAGVFERYYAVSSVDQYGIESAQTPELYFSGRGV
jgi:hypothetical protein